MSEWNLDLWMVTEGITSSITFHRLSCVGSARDLGSDCGPAYILPIGYLHLHGRTHIGCLSLLITYVSLVNYIRNQMNGQVSYILTRLGM